ncbi:uncharacterized protein [Mytilus edulis]|uniref:uncharacterized protein n=1 Tax=Mytilus edulis TaxID=6550 RepID=UPI0039F00AA7
MASAGLSDDLTFDMEEITEYRRLKKGDHLAVRGDHAGIQYYHHGIFLGSKKGVADFGGADKENAVLSFVDLMQFNNRGNRTIVRINYPPGKCLEDDVVVANAIKLVDNPGSWGPFNLLLNNCEHFATWCKTGHAVSIQAIQKLEEGIENVMLALKVVLPQISGSSF